jgi:hypothetical protein
VSTTGTSGGSTTSGTYADVGGGTSLSITPAATSSKVLAIFSFSSRSTGTNVQGGARILRGATEIHKRNVVNSQISTTETYSDSVLVYLDSPSTTSGTTYTLQFARTGGSGTFYIPSIPGSNEQYTITLVEIGA